MRVVVDTNVFVTALLQGPTPRRFYDAFLSGAITPVFSQTTLSELVDVLTRPSLHALTSRGEVTRFFALIERDGLLVRPWTRIRACRDPKDNIILECALAGRAHYIITGDKDLLELGRFRGVSIVRPSEFIRLLT